MKLGNNKTRFPSDIKQNLNLRQNKESAELFLKLLDPNAVEFTFQTFDDNSDRKVSNLTRVLHGSLDEHWDELVGLNRAGAGVFITVNRTNLNGRKATDIVAIRAVWQEDDGEGKRCPACDRRLKEYGAVMFQNTPPPDNIRGEAA